MYIYHLFLSLYFVQAQPGVPRHGDSVVDWMPGAVQHLLVEAHLRGRGRAPGGEGGALQRAGHVHHATGLVDRLRGERRARLGGRRGQGDIAQAAAVVAIVYFQLVTVKLLWKENYQNRIRTTKKTKKNVATSRANRTCNYHWRSACRRASSTLRTCRR